MATEIISVNNQGVQANGSSELPTLNGDGRYVVFESNASNLAGGNYINIFNNLFLYDRQTDTITRLTIGLGGAAPNSSFSDPSISADSRYIVFSSGATNLILDDVNDFDDIFIYDRFALPGQELRRISTTSSGAEANGDSFLPVVSGNNQFVVFESVATNFAPNDLNGSSDIFVKNIQTGAIQRITNNLSGFSANRSSVNPDISDDGRYVAFSSTAGDLVADASENNSEDVFVFDRNSNVMRKISAAPGSSGTQIDGNGTSRNAVLSADGRFVAFQSSATNLVANDLNGNTDIFIATTSNGVISRIAFGNSGVSSDGAMFNPSLSGDGRYVVFQSDATNLVADDTNNRDDIFVYDRQTGRIARVSVDFNAAGDDGVNTNDNSGLPQISDDGRVITFLSRASDLVPDDNDLLTDVFAVANPLFAGPINGTSGNDTIDGTIFNDVINGGAGADTMIGGLASDTYVVDNVGDAIAEQFGQGVDQVNSTVSYTLGLNVENLTLTGSAPINGVGNALNNVIVGNAASNTLTGGGGNDTLTGGLGADTLQGGAGDDTLIVDNVGDVVVELANQGTDRVLSAVSYTLSANVENLTLSGSASVNGTGNALNNILIGNTGANTLNGGLGNDSLSGSSGADIFVFSTGLGPNNVDVIVDYNVLDDTIHLENAVFTTLTSTGALAPSAFHVGMAAADAADRVIYNSATGDLFYDADGVGGQAQVRFADLASGLGLTSSDFIVI
ncbi:MAG: hypothetical protein NW215_14265 [Hyphomicrobiales bacterium]|nr:hypothetical protein [Hyphomicrobiales bacterium]